MNLSNLSLNNDTAQHLKEESKDQNIKLKREKKLKRDHSITKGNFNRWSSLLSSSDDTNDTELLDCLFEIFQFLSDSCNH